MSAGEQIQLLSFEAPGHSRLAYSSLGIGPGLVIVHGMMETSAAHTELAALLARDFTVYLVDRRGFGENHNQPFADGIGGEVRDLSSLVAETGARYVLGVSVGALICLHAAAANPAIKGVALFEPPLSIEGSAPTQWIAPAKAHLDRGDRISALVCAMIGTQMGPPLLAKMPFWLLKLITRASARSGGKTGAAMFVELAPTLAHDADLVLEAAGPVVVGSDQANRILLIGGSRSPSYFQASLSYLEQALPGPTRKELEGLDHQATGNSELGGRPDVVADALTTFFDVLEKSGSSV